MPDLTPPFPHGSAGAISIAEALRGAGHLLEARGLPLLHLRVGGPRDLARGPTVSRDWEKLVNFANFANFATFAIFFAEISRKLLFFQTDFLRKF